MDMVCLQCNEMLFSSTVIALYFIPEIILPLRYLIVILFYCYTSWEIDLPICCAIVFRAFKLKL